MGPSEMPTLGAALNPIAVTTLYTGGSCRKATVLTSAAGDDLPIHSEDSRKGCRQQTSERPHLARRLAREKDEEIDRVRNLASRCGSYLVAPFPLTEGRVL